MSEHYDFHYQPTGSGAISGQQVLQQTEDAINELGDYVNDNVGGAMDVAQQALETAQNAEQDAQTALDTANSFSGAIQSAQQDASTALSTAQTAQTTASNASNTAIQAQQDASSAVTTANNASGQVSTLSGTVTALGQRVTTAEGNIGQNTSDITALTTRVGTAEGNITTLQNDVSIAQGNASSAMATAGTVKQQAYVLRYSSLSITDNSTIAYSTLDNTDNIKSGDKVIDVDGKIFTVVSVDTTNQTVTVGSALIDLALDGNVVHTSGNETVAGIKNFTDDTYVKNINFTKEVASTSSSTTSVLQLINTVTYTDQTADKVAILNFRVTADGAKAFYPNENNQYSLGLQSRKWSEVHAITYYYGSSDVEFSNKFVTTDTDQTVGGNKTFSSCIFSDGSYLGNESSANERTNLCLRANRDTAGQSGAYIGRFRQNRAQGAMSGGDVSFVSLDFLENSTRYTRCFTMGLTDWDSDGVPQTYYITAPNGKGTLGTSYQQWNKVYANEYYYGSNSVEFSNKFCTLDTDQTVTSLKTFMGLRTEFKRSNNDGVLLFSNGSFSKGDTPLDITQISRKYYGDATSVASSIGYSSFSIQNNGNKTVYQLYSVANTAGSSLRTVFTLNYDKSLSGTDAQYATFGGNVLPDVTGTYNLGNSTNKWATINGLEPSALSMPDLANGIDISSYFDISLYTGQTYTPVANGWISISITSPNRGSLLCESLGISQTAYGVTDPDDNNKYRVSILIPCLKNQTLTTYIRASGGTINFAYFYPCLGNV